MSFIFGYGSIINRHTRKNVSPVDFSVRLKGYSRGWNARLMSEKITALGIVEQSDATCNGVLVSVTPALLDELDVREQSVGYERRKISLEDLEALSDGILPTDDKVFVYMLKKPTPPTDEFPIIQTYVDAVLFGCLEHGKGFAQEFIRTTEFWDGPWVDDRISPRYPRWKSEYASPAVNLILKGELGMQLTSCKNI